MKGSHKQRRVLRSAKGDLLRLPFPKLLAKVSHWYYVEGRLQAEIAEELGYEKTSSVTRLLKEARDRGVIEFSVDDMFAIGGRRDDSLSKDLRDRFDLNQAYVLNVDFEQASQEIEGLLAPRSRSASRHVDFEQTSQEIEEEHARDDYLHIALANHTGLELRGRIQPGDHVGVGSGRAVHQAMRVIKRRPPSLKNIRITSLSGRIWTKFWEVRGSSIKRPLDADDAARMLAFAFENEPGAVFSQIAYPLFLSEHEKPSTIMNEHCWFLPDGSWRDGQVPNRAFVGIGVVDPNSGHRFADLLRFDTEPPEMAPYLRRAADILKEAISLMERNKLPFFGDVTNRLFPVLPLPEELETFNGAGLFERYAEVISRLNQINEQMIVVGWDHLRQIPSVMAIAGGEFKVKALWTLLITRLIDPRRRIITELSTDFETAKKLLDALEKYSRSEKAQKWYGQMAQTIF